MTKKGQKRKNKGKKGKTIKRGIEKEKDKKGNWREGTFEREKDKKGNKKARLAGAVWLFTVIETL